MPTGQLRQKPDVSHMPTIDDVWCLLGQLRELADKPISYDGVEMAEQDTAIDVSDLDDLADS